MSEPQSTSTQAAEEKAIRQASRAALASLLNLTLLPVAGFIWLLTHLGTTDAGTIAGYHVRLGIRLNLIAAVTLLAVSGLMILFGGFDSPWTWVYVISYFTLVHSIFILIAVWTLVRAWSGQRLL